MSNSHIYIVTGGNRGIGFDLCRKLTSAGHHVILCSRNFSAGQEASQKINSANGKLTGSCQASELDVACPSSIQSFIAKVEKKHSKQIHALINNAGIYPDGWTQAIFDTAMSTNFTGGMDLAFGLAPHIATGGKIINVTSGLAKLQNLHNSYRDSVTNSSTLQQLQEIKFNPGNSPNSFKPTYCLTKAMVNRGSQILAKLPEFKHLSVNSADPGWCRTDMGGSSAMRSVSQGSDSILAALQLPPNVSGGFFFDGRASTF